jgi:hypothetical protein
MISRKRAIRPIIFIAVPATAVLVAMQLGCEKMEFWKKSPQPMESSTVVPASQGTVRATLGNNGNTNLSIRVKNLAPAYKVQPDATVYVVWIQQPNQPKQNIGALTLNKDLEGSLDTVTPFRRFSVSVTPEAAGAVEQPTHEPVFTAEVDRRD